MCLSLYMQYSLVFLLMGGRIVRFMWNSSFNTSIVAIWISKTTGIQKQSRFNRIDLLQAQRTVIDHHVLVFEGRVSADRKACYPSALLLAFCLDECRVMYPYTHKQSFSGLCCMSANVFVALWQNTDATYWFPSGGVTIDTRPVSHSDSTITDRLLDAAASFTNTAHFTYLYNYYFW